MTKLKFGNWNWNWNENFSFEVFTEDTVANAIKNLPTGKAIVPNGILVSIIKENIDAYCPKLTETMNDCLKNFFFLMLK